MSVYRLIFQKTEPWKIRCQAFANLFCVMYMITISLLVTHYGFFYVLPACYASQPWTVFMNRLAITYLFMSVISQFVTCVATDTGVELHRKVPYSQNVARARSGKQVKKEFLTSVNDSTKIIAVGSNPRMQMTLEGMHFCKLCNYIVPPRTHHCFLCKKCVIKRDHHCFFMGVCIGQTNHLYFIYFTLFMGIGTFYGMLFFAKYLFYFYGIRFYGPQTFVALFINTMLSLLKGSLPTARFLYTFILMYLSLFGTVFSLSFFLWHVFIVLRGQTTFEARRGIKSFTSISWRSNLRAVFRPGCLAVLLIPFWDMRKRNDMDKNA